MKSTESIAVPNGVATDTFPDVAVCGTDVVIEVLVTVSIGAGLELNWTRFPLAAV